VVDATTVWVWVSRQEFVFFWGERAPGRRLRQRMGVPAAPGQRGVEVSKACVA